MYLILFVFGVVLSAAGIALAAAGVSLHDRTFDTTIVTPGVVAVVGGLLLIGLGLALRVLQRIERVLAVRQIVPASAGETAQIPLPKLAPHPVASPTVVSGEERRLDNPPEHTPAPVHLPTAPAIEEAELPSSPAAAPPLPTTVDLAVEAEKARTAKRKNGAAAGRLSPPLDTNLRAPDAAARPAGPSFDALWLKGPRSIRAVPPVPARATVRPVAEPEVVVEPAAAAVQAPAPDIAAPPQEPVSVLKAGVVDGMAYTLYSDGSIEAQLPQGMLRFGSITELRNHIEQSA